MNKEQQIYDALLRDAAALLEGERHPLANCANLAALVGERLPRINWAGFYFVSGGQLVLGPFWGKPACVRIAKGRGVCGTAYAENRNQRVADVHLFPGHIACDAASASELVILLHRDGKVIGMLDLDSPEKNRFSQQDEEMLSRLAQLLETGCSWEDCGYTLI